jgi:hypothetical protein
VLNLYGYDHGGDIYAEKDNVIDFSINIIRWHARLRKASGGEGGRGLREITGPQLPQTQAGHFDPLRSRAGFCHLRNGASI